MTKPFNTLLQKMSPESRGRVQKRKEELLRELTIRELRQALDLTQQQLAETLKVNQAAVSKIESESDMYVSTLRRFLEAMGASLKIVAVFPDGEISISQFGKGPKSDSKSAAV